MTFHQATAPTAAQLDALRRSFRGEIVTPDASGYDDARRVWNAVFDRRPALVVRPSTVDDVVAGRRLGRGAAPRIALRRRGRPAPVGPPASSVRSGSWVTPVWRA